MGDVLVRLLASVLFGAIPAAILFATGPPKHGSWWDYPLKLRLYAILDANTPSQPAERWFVRVIASIVLIVTWACLWS
jgi:hypothetical protein